MRQLIFLDTGIFVAFLNRKDEWHEQAVGLFNTGSPLLCTSYLVVSEAYSWFLHRFGEEASRKFLLLLDHLQGLKIFESTKEHHQRTQRILNRLRGTKLTYVDASSLCFLEKHKIKKVWSTDHHLSLTGAEVLPRL